MISYIKATAAILKEKYNGDIPDTIEGLISLPGVGKRANEIPSAFELIKGKTNVVRTGPKMVKNFHCWCMSVELTKTVY